MPQIRYTFTESGADGVAKAFESIGSAAQRSTAQVQKGFQQVKAGNNRTAQTQARSEKNVAAQKIRLARQVAQHHQRIARDEQRALQKDERAKVQAARKRLARVKRLVRQQRMQAREEVRVAKAAEREKAKAQRETAKRSRGRRALAGSILGGVARAGAAVAGATVGISGAAAREALSLQDRTTKLAIQGGRNESGALKFNPKDLADEFSSIATSFKGIKSVDLADAVGAFVTKTGDLESGLAFAEEFAKISLATGTNMEEVGSAAADLMQKFDVRTVSGMADALAVLTEQGKQGAFELEDAAAAFPKIAAAASVFGLKGEKGLAQLGGLAQIARTGTGDGASAATAVENMFKQLVAKSSDIRKGAGVEVFADPKTKTRARDIQELLPEMIAGFGGNIEKLGKVFPKATMAAVNPMISTFNKAANQVRDAGGKEEEARKAGADAVRAQLKNAIEVENAKEKVAMDAAAAQETASNSLVQAWQSVVSEVGGALVPTITEWAGQFADFVAETDFEPLITAFEDVAAGAAALAELLDIFPKKKNGIKDQAAGVQKKIDRQRLSGTETAYFDSLIADEKRFGVGTASGRTFGSGAKAAGVLQTGDNAAANDRLFNKFEKYKALMAQLDAITASDKGNVLDVNEAMNPVEFQKRFAADEITRYEARTGEKASDRQREDATKKARLLAGRVLEDPSLAGNTDGSWTRAGLSSGQSGELSEIQRSLIEKLGEEQALRQGSGQGFSEGDMGTLEQAQSALAAKLAAAGDSAQQAGDAFASAAAKARADGGGSSFSD